MPDFPASGSCFCILLTLLCFSFGSFLQKKTKLAVLNPILLAAIMVIVLLQLLGIPNEAYQEGCKTLQFFLTPDTICLAIGFYEQFSALKQHLLCICAGVTAGVLSSIGTVYLLSGMLQLDTDLMLSLLPKSVTTAIGTPLSEELGGIASIATAAIVITGVIGNMMGPALSKLLRIHDPIAQGVAFGTSAHVIATAKAAQISELTGAVSSLSLTVCGLITTIILSFLTQFLP